MPSWAGSSPLHDDGRPLAGLELETEEQLDQPRVEVAPRLGAQLLAGRLDGPRGLVRPVGDQRVEHVADRADAPGERDRLAREAGGVTAAVPALVVGAG